MAPSRFPVLLGPTEFGIVIFECPACRTGHRINLDLTQWNRDRHRPTFKGELVFGRCVSTIRDGLITFKAGVLAGQTVALQENF